MSEKNYNILKNAHYGNYRVNIIFNDENDYLKNGIYEVAGLYNKESVSLKDKNPGSELKSVDISNIKSIVTYPSDKVVSGGKRRNKKTYKRRNKKSSKGK